MRNYGAAVVEPLGFPWNYRTTRWVVVPTCRGGPDQCSTGFCCYRSGKGYTYTATNAVSGPFDSSGHVLDHRTSDCLCSELSFLPSTLISDGIDGIDWSMGNGRHQFACCDGGFLADCRSGPTPACRLERLGNSRTSGSPSAQTVTRDHNSSAPAGILRTQPWIGCFFSGIYWICVVNQPL